MNVGQILETHLGWASKELGNSLKRLFSKEVKAEALRRWFREVFGETAIWKSLAKLEDDQRSEEHTSELQSQSNLVCRLLLEKKKKPPTKSNKDLRPPRRPVRSTAPDDTSPGV